MQNREKEIEEMAKAMCGNGMLNGNCATDDEPCGLECVYGWCAEKLYAKGYRKQKEGEWLEIDDGVSIGDGKHLECSECGVWKKDKQRSNFCSHCGAKMKGGAE